MSDLVVIGAGGHAKVVVATARAAGFDVVAVLDDDGSRRGRAILGARVEGTTAELGRWPDALALLAIGSNRVRKELAARLPARWATLVHPSAVVHESVRIGEGTVVFAGAVIQPDTVLGAHVIVNTAASIDHDCQVGDFAHVAPGSHLAGGVSLGEGAFLGIGAKVIPGRRVGSWATVGAGGVVIRDIGEGCVAVGVPARERGPV